MSVELGSGSRPQLEPIIIDGVSELESDGLSQDASMTKKGTISAALPAYHTASSDRDLESRRLVQLLQCEVCHRILRQPLTLPCGQTLCRSCLPSIHDRRNISYPNEPNRLQGFACPFAECEGKEHSVADCNTDITLANILLICKDILSSEPLGPLHDLPDHLIYTPADLNNDLLSPKSPGSTSTLAFTYRLAQQGLLPSGNEDLLNAPSLPEPADPLDKQLLDALQSRIRPELDCHVCYSLYHHPTTTSCGHTFCRSCLERVADHSNFCPLCRRPLSSYRSVTAHGGNKRLESLLSILCPDAVATREAHAAENVLDGEHSVPIFACSLTFPHLPLFLHIFEPRYRLMVRRAVNDGTRCFGMVSHQEGPRAPVDGDFDAPFVRYGTMLRITNLQMLRDGRSILELVGTYRFRIVSYIWKDGYPLANIERLEDLPFAEEETIEAAERLLNSSSESSPPDLGSLSTQELYQQVLDFLDSMQSESAQWFTDRLLRNYGPPPRDPALLPFWIATLLPVNDREKYMVLVSTTTRERLKMVVTWIRRMDRGSWSSTGGIGDICIVS
ncbi:hypothetical protein TWF696_005182 [Orbilia brochopaga]|uniref:Uncharacterized protein n=1 Tax=Orbilia brochopaga TaxID=3140254 RepID=A0AAV9V1L8_9PEZI